MIYALTKQDTSHFERTEIAQAIKDGKQDVIEKHVAKGTIIHVMADLNARNLYCIFCYNDLFPTNARKARECDEPGNWHFQHKGTGHTPGKCVKHERHSPIPYALGIKNPAKHGCYICLDCETDVNGDPTKQCHQKCKTIVNGQTYCHLAIQHKCTS